MSWEGVVMGVRALRGEILSLRVGAGGMLCDETNACWASADGVGNGWAGGVKVSSFILYRSQVSFLKGNYTFMYLRYIYT